MSGTIATQPNGRPQVCTPYESIEFNVVTATTDYDVDSSQSTFKAVIANPQYVEISTNYAITIKFNATTNHSISIGANTLRVFDRQIFDNLYITNTSGSTAAVKLYIK